MVSRTKLLALLLTVFVVVRQVEGSEQDSSAESNEEREKRGSYNARPPFSPAGHISGASSVVPAELFFQQVIAGGRPSVNILPQGNNVGYPDRGRCSGEFPCAAMVYCAPFFEEVRAQNLGCSFGPWNGACCRFPQRRLQGSAAFGSSASGAAASPSAATFAPLSFTVEIQSFSAAAFSLASQDSLQAIEQRDVIEVELQRRGISVTNPRRPAYGHLQFFRTSALAEEIARSALMQNFIGSALQQRLQLSPVQAGFGLKSVNALTIQMQAGPTCPMRPYCGKKSNFYRTIDGSCNNFYNPKWGQARTAFQRIVPPVYTDGISIPRKSVTGAELPSARVVSLSTLRNNDNPSREFSLSVMQWGQFIDHDLVHTPIFRFGNQSGIECCDENGQLVDLSLLHPECFPISLPELDPFFGNLNRRCMNFVRSLPAPQNNCTLGFREQMNQVTHFLDGSAVYGSSEEDERALREGQGGLLKTFNDEYLPPDMSLGEEDCFLLGTGLSCFLAGDNRVNEQPQLSVIHTIWLRQHNRIARKLSDLNPHWYDETLYQETRRIVGAQIQHIVYNEWLPLILGTNTVEGSKLLPQRNGFNEDYDKFLNPNIRNEFGTVAFRFGHTLVQGMINLFDENHRQTQKLNLFENFNRPRVVYDPTKFDELLRGLFKQPMQSFDNNVVEDLTNRLFQTDQMSFGMDLPALNIQRARDHGIASYNDLRVACGLPRATRFEDLLDFVRPESVAVFRNIYASVDDIDPFVAGISEIPVNGGILGPTFNCIIRDQFTRLKFGDRFFYENGGQTNSFTEAQLHEIRKTSWASIICQNSDIDKIQPLAMRLPGPNNQKVPCSSLDIPKLDCLPWSSSKRDHYN